MKSDRRAATLIGVLYIIGTAAGVASAMILPSLADGADLLGRVAAQRTEVIVGALLVLTMGFALSALSAVFYPIGRRFNEALSMGYVIFRGALEGMLYIVGVYLAFVLVAMSAEPTAAAGPIASVLANAYGVLWSQLLVLPFVIGAAMFYWVLYRARLVPRWLSVWGLVAIPLYAGAAFAQMAGLSLDVLMFPLAIQEMVLAVWLVAKGFNAEALGHADDARVASGTPAGSGVRLPGMA
jgi:hypothetical protein